MSDDLISHDEPVAAGPFRRRLEGAFLASLAGGLLALALSGCASPMGITGGESVRPLEPAVPTLTIAVVAADDSTALPATVGYLGDDEPTDETGHLTVEWRSTDEAVTVTASAPGFVTRTTELIELPDHGAITVALDPVVLSGRVTTPDGRPLPATAVTLGRARARTDENGIFQISRAVPGDLALSRPAWMPAVVPWDGAQQEVSITLEPRMVRGLRVAGDKAGDRAVWKDRKSVV